MLKDNYKRFREAKGLTTYELAEKLGVSQSTVARIENGSLMPSYPVLVLSAKIFEVSLDDFEAK